MAGIGFRLKKLFAHDTYIDNFRAIVFSSSIAGGPIFFSILCLVLLGIFSSTFLSGQEMNVFLVTIVYIFAFSLISTGLTQLLITRYLSDLIYANEVDRILPTFTSVLTVTVISQLVFGLPFLFFWDIGFMYKLTVLILFVTIGCIWQLMVFLSAVKNYRIVIVAFVAGLTVSLLLALFLGQDYGLTGFLHGYTIGQILLMFILLARVFVEFRSSIKPQFEFLQYISKMPHLIFIGFFYNLGIWIDKMIFWFSPHGEQVNSFLYAHASYDGATFFSYLTVIPSYTYFLVKVETDFYGYYRSFYHAILKRESYKKLELRKVNIARSIRESLSGLIKLQGAVTLLCLLFAQDLAALFHIPALGSMILEKTLIAVFLQMLLLTIMIFMLYFDIKSKIVIVAGVFTGSNLLLTLLSLKLGYVYFGYGFLLACLISLGFAYVYLNEHVKDLEYHTFVSLK